MPYQSVLLPAPEYSLKPPTLDDARVGPFHLSLKVASSAGLKPQHRPVMIAYLLMPPPGHSRIYYILSAPMYCMPCIRHFSHYFVSIRDETKDPWSELDETAVVLRFSFLRKAGRRIGWSLRSPNVGKKYGFSKEVSAPARSEHGAWPSDQINLHAEGSILAPVRRSSEKLQFNRHQVMYKWDLLS